MLKKLTIKIGTGQSTKTFSTVKAARKFAEKCKGRIIVRAS